MESTVRKWKGHLAVETQAKTDREPEQFFNQSSPAKLSNPCLHEKQTVIDDDDDKYIHMYGGVGVGGLQAWLCS